MKNLFNDIDSSEKDRILEMHKRQGYGTINEQNSAAGGFDINRFNKPGGRPTAPKAFKNPFTPQPQQNTNPNSNALTPNQQKASAAGYGSMTPEAADKLAKETNGFQIKKNTFNRNKKHQNSRFELPKIWAFCKMLFQLQIKHHLN